MKEQTLRKILWADVYGSAISVVFTIVGAGLIAGWLDVSVWIPLAVGVVLIPWVLFLVNTVRQSRLRPTDLIVIVAGNIGWALLAAIVIFGVPDALSTSGKWIVGIFS